MYDGALTGTTWAGWEVALVAIVSWLDLKFLSLLVLMLLDLGGQFEHNYQGTEMVIIDADVDVDVDVNVFVEYLKMKVYEGNLIQ